jgi:phospholipid/cholesterol/gamma-HCH transport system substrate-binding protein
MEDKLNPTLVGAFVLLLGAALVAAVLWLSAGVGGGRPSTAYQTIFSESVAGLNLDAPVKYLGVDVGKVRSITIDPDNPRQVRLGLLIDQGTPVKQDSEAVLKSQGLTGIAYVELGGGSPGSPALVSAADGAPALIRSKPSLGARLENVMTTVLASVDRTSGNLNSLLSADNQAAIQRSLADASALLHTLAEQRGALAAGITDLATTARHAAAASAQLGPVVAAAGPAIERVGPVLARLEAAAVSVDSMAQAAGLASTRAGQAAEAALGGVQQLRGDTLPGLDRLLAELGPLVGSLRQLSDQLRSQPSSLLVGGAPRAPGPGEGVTP